MEEASKKPGKGADVHHLLGAEARAILEAVERAIAQGEITNKQLGELTDRVMKLERAGWASRDAAVGTKQVVTTASEDVKKRFENIERDVKEIKANFEGMAERTASEYIRLTIEQRKLKGEVKAIAENEARPPDGVQRRRSLPSLGEFDEDTGQIILNQFIARAKTDADFAHEAARAGVGIRVETWKTVLKWGTTIIASLGTGGLLYKLVEHWLSR